MGGLYTKRQPSGCLVELIDELPNRFFGDTCAILLQKGIFILPAY